MIESGQSQLLRYINEPLETQVPPGWFTAEQYAKQTGLSNTTVLRYIRDGMKKKTIEKREFVIPLPNRSPRPVPHYYLKKRK